jgi:hypothetical protein
MALQVSINTLSVVICSAIACLVGWVEHRQAVGHLPIDPSETQHLLLIANTLSQKPGFSQSD